MCSIRATSIKLPDPENDGCLRTASSHQITPSYSEESFALLPEESWCYIMIWAKHSTNRQHTWRTTQFIQPRKWYLPKWNLKGTSFSRAQTLQLCTQPRLRSFKATEFLSLMMFYWSGSSVSHFIMQQASSINPTQIWLVFFSSSSDPTEKKHCTRSELSLWPSETNSVRHLN